MNRWYAKVNWSAWRCGNAFELGMRSGRERNSCKTGAKTQRRTKEYKGDSAEHAEYLVR